MIIAGEFTSAGHVDHDAIARQAIREIGYIDPSEPLTRTVFRFISSYPSNRPKSRRA